MKKGFFLYFLFLFSCSTQEQGRDILHKGNDISYSSLLETGIDFLEEEVNENTDFDALLKRAQYYYDSQDYTNALADLYRLLTFQTENPDLYVLKAWTHYKIASFDEAESAAELAESLGADSNSFYMIKGLLHARKKEAEKSKNYLQNALVRAPYSGEVWNTNAQALIATGDTILAQQSFVQALRFNPDIYDAYYMMGETLMSQGQIDSALTFNNIAISKFAEDSKLLIQRSEVFERAGRADSAIAILESVYDLDESRLEILTQIGNIYFKNKKYGSAFVKYNEVSKKLPNNANMRYLAGLCLERTGRYSEAQAFYTIARSKDEENELYERAFNRARYLEERKYSKQLTDTSAEEEQKEELVRKRIEIAPIESKKKVKINQ